MNPYKVLIVDDCVIMTKVIQSIIESSKQLVVIGTAENPYEARQMIKTLKPDVLTLDIELPKMDGITFLDKIMKLHPIPVVMLSSFTQKGAPMSVKALERGAIDFINKPNLSNDKEIEIYTRLLTKKLINAATANLGPILDRLANTNRAPQQPTHQVFDFKEDAIIAIGASTGGIESIKVILESMPNNCPPIIISQHIPPVFSTSVANRLNTICKINVFEVKDNQKLENGSAYLAPGDYHLLIQRMNNGLHARVKQTDKVNLHRPSVDAMFESLAELSNPNAIGIILTGMGRDGAKGLLKLKNLGCSTIAQNKETSVVWGMPKAAIDLDAASYILPLNQICEKALSESVEQK